MFGESRLQNLISLKVSDCVQLKSIPSLVNLTDLEANRTGIEVLKEQPNYKMLT